jgi:hypothetical protein
VTVVSERSKGSSCFRNGGQFLSHPDDGDLIKNSVPWNLFKTFTFSFSNSRELYTKQNTLIFLTVSFLSVLYRI